MRQTELGRIEIETVPLPEWMAVPTFGHFTSTGTILVEYRAAGQDFNEDYYHLAVLNADGTAAHTIFEGKIPKKPKANGIRFLPLADNRRILCGDYMIECEPDIDRCECAQVIPIAYPEGLQEDRLTVQSWTEIIMAPDCEHIAWTTVRGDIGSVNFLGRLVRKEDHYEVADTRIISNMTSFCPVQDGRIVPDKFRNWELKQFIRGGLALSVASSEKAGTLDSMIQHLDSPETEKVTDTPSYEETTIFSPDERLGLTMSTRFSPATSSAVYALLPRPLGCYSTLGLMMPVYMYGVMDVRHYHAGNIGPVLIEIGKSQTEPGYEGIDLHDLADEWVFCSPMSWHPDGKRAMWNEMNRRSYQEGHEEHRLRIVTLPDYEPGPVPAVHPTPDDVSYAVKGGLEAVGHEADADVVLPGRVSGRILYKKLGRAGMQTLVGSLDVVYENYSDDGISVWNGFERLHYAPVGRTEYEADITLTGPKPGRMQVHTVYHKAGMDSPYVLVKEEDGRTVSEGFASYEGVTLQVADML